MYNEIKKSSKEVSINSYSPYSKFKVGGAVQMKDGKIFKGTNIENASFGGTICAERVAIFNAITEGYKKGDFEAIAIFSNTKQPVKPCGFCQQIMIEFFNEDTKIILLNETDEEVYNLAELQPHSFKELV